MTEDPGQGPPAERVLDLLVYAPVGLVVSVVEPVPGLVRKGRERLAPQVGVARTVGQFAVHQGYRQFLGYAMSRGAFPFRPPRPARTYSAYPADAPAEDGPAAADGHTMQAPALEASPDQPVGPGAEAPTGLQPADLAPTDLAPTDVAPADVAPEDVSPEDLADADLAVADLAIPSYDSLSATQVVERLAGLSQDEVRAVAAYEAATRRRKTVLDRAEQLLNK